MIRIILSFTLLVLFLPKADLALACGSGTNCEIGDRHYRIRMPDGHDGISKVGAIIYAHGYRGSAKGMMKNKSMTKLASELGVALVATKSFADDWRIPGVPRNRDTNGELELIYYDTLVEDITSRFPIDRKRLMSTGFSAGGMMVWNLICHRSELFAAFVPMSGTFWRPEPTTCTSPPASVIHIHGDADPVVPLMGRPIADTHQGKVPTVLKMYAEYGNYRFAGEEAIGELKCRNTRNSNGDILNMCLFPGGHSFKTEFVRQAWKKLEAAGKL